MAFKYSCVLTGGIATGKSTVCSFLNKHGFSIIDADIVAKEQLENSKKELKKLFGETIFNGSIIDRKKLADIIFNSEEERKKLNNLIHPKVRLELEKRALEKSKDNIPYIVDIPLFFESKIYDCELSVVVYTPRDIQTKRLMKRESITKEEAIKRVNSQIDIDKKRRMADLLIDNSLDKKHLEEEIEKFIKYVKKERICK